MSVGALFIGLVNGCLRRITYQSDRYQLHITQSPSLLHGDGKFGHYYRVSIHNQGKRSVEISSISYQTMDGETIIDKNLYDRNLLCIYYQGGVHSLPIMLQPNQSLDFAFDTQKLLDILNTEHQQLGRIVLHTGDGKSRNTKLTSQHLQSLINNEHI